MFLFNSTTNTIIPSPFRDACKKMTVQLSQLSQRQSIFVSKADKNISLGGKKNCNP